jgi:hypothetical protein
LYRLPKLHTLQISNCCVEVRFVSGLFGLDTSVRNENHEEVDYGEESYYRINEIDPIEQLVVNKRNVSSVYSSLKHIKIHYVLMSSECPDTDCLMILVAIFSSPIIQRLETIKIVYSLSSPINYDYKPIDNDGNEEEYDRNTFNPMYVQPYLTSLRLNQFFFRSYLLSSLFRGCPALTELYLENLYCHNPSTLYSPIYYTHAPKTLHTLSISHAHPAYTPSQEELDAILRISPQITTFRCKPKKTWW